MSPDWLSVLQSEQTPAIGGAIKQYLSIGSNEPEALLLMNKLNADSLVF